MAGGNMRVFAKAPGAVGLAKLSNTRALDAHALEKGTFTAERNVNGHKVYLTPAGAAALDALIADGFEVSAEADPSLMMRVFSTDIAKLTSSGGEEFQGKVK